MWRCSALFGVLLLVACGGDPYEDSKKICTSGCVELYSCLDDDLEDDFDDDFDWDRSCKMSCSQLYGQVEDLDKARDCQRSLDAMWTCFGDTSCETIADGVYCVDEQLAANSDCSELSYFGG